MHEANNVLLVILDSTRAENTSLHGYERETTPFLEEFADRSTLYTQARAPSIHSIASHVSMFTGAHVEEHQAMRHTAQIDTTQSIWHELSAEHDYETGLFTNNRIVSNASNLGACFDYKYEPAYPLTTRLENTLDHPFVEQLYFRSYNAYSRLTEGIHRRLPDAVDTLADSASRGIDGLAAKIDEATPDSDGESEFKTEFGETFTDAFLDWESRQNGPWAACINLMDTHSPYQPESEFDRWADESHWELQGDMPSVRDCLNGTGWDQVEALEPLYDGTIRQADAIVRDLVSELESRGLLSETLVVVTSDHGEAFGEQSRLNPDLRLRGHKWGIPEVLTHVPLVVSYPWRDGGEVVDDIVSLTDTPALLRSALDAPADNPLVSREPVLASTFRIPEAKRRKYQSIADIDAYIGPWRAVYEQRDETVRKFAQKGDHYVTIDIDASGAVSVVSRDPHERVSDAYEHLADDSIVTEETSEIDDELESQLEDLGYIR